jgi:hypothetical protein
VLSLPVFRNWIFDYCLSSALLMPILKRAGVFLK